MVIQYSNCPFEITPLDQSEPIKTPNLVNLNYTNQDFWSMKTRLINFIREKFGEDFNDFVESSIAIMLIENWAFLADTLSFKTDQVANEIFIDTVSEVENAFRLSKLVGFKPTPPIAATSLWTATINSVLNTDLRMSTPVIIDIASDGIPTTIELFPADSNNQPVFDEDIIIPAGKVTNSSVIGIEGRTRDQVSVGDGSINQTIELSTFPVIFNSIRVEVDGLEWNEVEYFTDSQPRSEFRVEFNSEYKAFIIFGNNRAGRIPSPGSQIRVTYRTGGGPIGNIVTGSVQEQRVFPVEGFNFTVPVAFRNYTSGLFGYSGDGIADIQRKLPAYLRTQNRAVTGGDYKTVSEQFATAYSGQIGKAVAVLRNYGCAGNIIDLYVLARNGDQDLIEAPSELKVALTEEIEIKKMITDHVCIRDGVILQVDVSIDITADKFFRKFELEVREKVTRRTNTFFSLNNWDYGKTLKDTDLIKTLSDVPEVSSFDINFTTNDADNSGNIVTSKFYEIIRPDSIDITFMYI